MVYRSFAESIISYGIIMWGGTYSSILEPLLIMQKYVLKVMLFKARRFSTDLLFAEAKLLDVKSLYYQKSITYVHKQPQLRTTINHNYNTRTRLDGALAVPRMRLSQTQRFILYTGPKLYNLVPDNFKNVNNTSLFSKKMYRYIHDNKMLFNI